MRRIEALCRTAGREVHDAMPTAWLLALHVQEHAAVMYEIAQRCGRT